MSQGVDDEPQEKPKHPIFGRLRYRRKIHCWQEEPFNTAREETSLWAAVITQAMMDALSRSRHGDAPYHKECALRWLTGNSRDFAIVCHYAGLDPDFVRRRAKQAILTPRPWRAEAGKGSRYLRRRPQRQRNRALPEPADDSVIRGPWSAASE